MKKVTLLLSICFLTALTAGCKSTAKTAATETTSNCQIASSNKVEMAFSEAQASLSNRECWMGFDSQFTSLLNIAKGDPNNFKPLSALAAWNSWNFSLGEGLGKWHSCCAGKRCEYTSGAALCALSRFAAPE